MPLTLRSVKGSALTHNEVDANFSLLSTSSGIANASTVVGATITAALNTLGTAAAAAVVSLGLLANSSGIANASTVPGSTVTAALNALLALGGGGGGGGGSVTSVFGRTGVVTAVVGDYTSTTISNLSSVAGSTVTAALNTLQTAISGGVAVSSVFGRTGAIVAVSGDYTSNTIPNLSSVPGSSVTAALNNISAGTLPTNLTGETLKITGTNESVNNTPGETITAHIYGSYNTLTGLDLNCNFSNATMLRLGLDPYHGDNYYGIWTQSKTTFIANDSRTYAAAAGQRLVDARSLWSFGMGDANLMSMAIYYASGPITGDEGLGIQPVSYIQQQTYLIQSNIASKPAQSTLNTTCTQAIVKSQTPQTITVASTTGIAPNQWVCVQPQAPTASPNMEPVLVTAVGAGTITGLFRCNHDSGTAIVGAVVLVMDSTAQIGQQRVMVNLSGTTYNSGTLTSVGPGGSCVGSGTSWTTSMVGGSALNIGAISFAGDDVTDGPFGGTSGPLKSWYEISSVNSPTSLGFFKTSCAGDAGYQGRATAGGAYTIKPCARVLYVYDHLLVLAPSTSTWSVGDVLECAICPYSDVHGYIYQLFHYNPGATLRSFIHVRNEGLRMWDTLITAQDGSYTGIGQADACAFNTLINFGNVTSNSGIQFGDHLAGAINFLTVNSGGATSDLAGKITWGGSQYIKAETTPGSQFGLRIGGASNAQLDFLCNTHAETTALLGGIKFQGLMKLCTLLATPAGGAVKAGLHFGTTANFGVFYGSGVPTLQAAGGSIYLRQDAAPWYNTSGGTTWAQLQPVDAEITAIAGLASTADTAPYFTGLGTAALMTVTAAARSVLAGVSVAAMLTTLGGQPVDATTTALAGVTTAADKIIYATGIDTFATTDLTSTARTLLSGTSIAAMRTTLGLVIGTDVQAFDTNTLKSNAAANLTVGYTATAENLGTITTGTITPNPANGTYKRAINGGAFNLAPPSIGSGDSASVSIQITNNASAGTITPLGYTWINGDSLTTTNGDDFRLDCWRCNSFSVLTITKLQ